MKKLFSLCLVLSTLSSSQYALAAGWLDYIRNYDLNDYALGVSISTSESPYVGGENSLFAYPYLTSFRDSAFTDDWLVLREGELGGRWVTESGWELGLLGRIQTLGFGNSDAPELRGMADREWTIEAGPMIGWRAWPVHINFAVYAEILGLHDGFTNELTFSVPYEGSRGYIVPHLRFTRQDSEYANYYYGVLENEASAARPAYDVGDAVNTELKIRIGYALSEKWLLSGSAGIEFLDSNISNSPIVDEDSVWSASIGLAYNTDIFQPRDTGGADWEEPRFEIRVGVFNDTIESKIVHAPVDGEEGSEIDLEDTLGISDEDTVLQLDAILRIGNFHQLEMGYFEVSRHGSSTLEQTIDIGGEEFEIGTVVNSSFETKILRLGYTYTLMKDEQKELGVMGGVHYSTFKTEISAEATAQEVTSDAGTPLPVVGMHASVALGAKMKLGAKIQFFRLEFDRYEGSLNYLSMDLRRQINDRFGVGVSYTYYTLKLDSKSEDLRGSLEVIHRGPSLFFSAAF